MGELVLSNFPMMWVLGIELRLVVLVAPLPDKLSHWQMKKKSSVIKVPVNIRKNEIYKTVKYKKKEW